MVLAGSTTMTQLMLKINFRNSKHGLSTKKPAISDRVPIAFTSPL
jgi:hypothetical protein